MADLTLRNVRLLVTDFAESFRFYRDVIGLTPRHGSERDSRVFFTDRTESGFELVDRSSMEAARQGDGTTGMASDRATLVFETRDVHEDVRALRGLGAQIASEPTDVVPLGIRKAYVRDPEGNLIELVEKLS